MNNLCLSSLFEKEIRGTLDTLQYDIGNSGGTFHTLQSDADGIKDLKDDVEATSLCFRLLRQYGIMFHKTGAFNERLRANIRGVLQLYEASHLAIQEENIVNKENDFSEECLKDLNPNIDVYILKRVTKALEYPQHWMVQWFWVKWQIDAYEHQVDRNPMLVELSKLNFNMIQAIHQRELQELSV
ncbi:hypothetical protein Nepgr_032142 [Nepenthes gracilis]|uniref:Terpene synthase N-terminal domain-containing protein n=1 Tax=Nepenthes gracilis TaxID=150966 RepID=A0AAD3Y7N2_NEPGR|nr:hypothetical protein Nepgr_032142 [Nepenthes gracilis]